jgi:hypothetical protein
MVAHYRTQWNISKAKLRIRRFEVRIPTGARFLPVLACRAVAWRRRCFMLVIEDY